MLQKLDLLSENQTMAQIKLLEAWKAKRDPDFPIKMMKNTRPEKEEQHRTMRAMTRRAMKEEGKIRLAEDILARDSMKNI